MVITMLNHCDDVVLLRKVTPDIKDGFSTKTATTTEVWAEKQSAKRSEFYAAAGVKRNIDVVFVINALDYSDEEELEHDGNIYDIVRAYQKDLDHIELSCERRRTQ